MEIRGAPALGVAGAFGVALAALTVRAKEFPGYMDKVDTAARAIGDARPTAVNLSRGVQRVLAQLHRAKTIEEARMLALGEAQSVANEDAASCHSIGNHGAVLIGQKSTVLTHCNAGALACSSWGTALGVIRSAVQAGKKVKVIASETRPLLQGARLTAWELKRDGIDVTVIPDSAAAHLMRKGEIDCVIVGADRITPDVVFNKIGTYMHAVCAAAHSVPFYVAAPFSTFDPLHSEGEVIIEERDRVEIAFSNGRMMVPENVPVWNPAFDATPLALVSAIITEWGILRPPFDLTALAPTRRVI
jgi:methylthioribose-1-phosphate isomerase